jgi:gamma-glutamylcysteine synthetase
LRSDCAAAGIDLADEPVDPRPLEALPLQLTTPRYLAMEQHFDSIGPAGRRMMRATASTQVCLDWWPGASGVEQWRLLQLAGPFLAAAFARSTGPQSRLATWLAVDPGRTAFDDRLLHGDDPVASYGDLAAGATVFVSGGVEEHLSTLFPPIRPRGCYLEVRFADVQTEERVDLMVTTLSNLLYDGECRRRALTLLEPERSRLGEHWAAAAAGDSDSVGRGLALVDLTSDNAVGAA